MQTLNFTQKLLRQQRFFSALIPLLAVFLGLGSVNKANAQAATFSGQQIVVDQGNGNVTYPVTTFNGSFVLANQTPPGTVTSFDINGTLPIFNGGSVSVAGNGTTTGITSASMLYEVRNASFALIGSGTLAMSTTSPAGNNRTFTLSGANVSLVSTVTTAGTYYFGVNYSAGYQKSGVPPGGNTFDPNGFYYAQFTVTGIKAPPPTINAAGNPANISVASDGNASTLYYFPNNPGSTPQFPGATLTSTSNANSTPGSFDVNNGQLRLQNTTVTTTEAGASTISGVVLYYRTRLSGTAGGAYQPIALVQSGLAVSGARTFVIDPNNAANTTNQPNLITTPAVTAAGTYVVDIYYQANGTNNGTPFTLFYPPAAPSTPYSATFVVTGVPTPITVWTGAINDNWFDTRNWDNGVPAPTKNALVRDLGSGSTVPYPNINSGVRVPATGTLLYDNTNSGPAQVRTLTMGGTSQANRSITRLIAGQLEVFVDFNNVQDSFIQRANTIVTFAGSGSTPQDPTQAYYNAPVQTITGGSFVRVDIAGNGKKLVTGVMNIAEALNFLTPSLNSVNTVIPNPDPTMTSNGGILATDINTPSTSVVVLADRDPINNNNGAQINGETDSPSNPSPATPLSYLYGFVRTTRASVGVNDPRTYGNMGLELNFMGTNAPGNVDVTRNTVEAYAPVSSKYGIRRIFGVRPTNTSGLNATMIFHYRTSETQRLNGPSTTQPGTSSIPEPQLAIFVSTNAGNTFGLVGRDGPVNTTAKTVTKTGVTTFATFTLGDILNPLPVRLTALDAKRMGSNTLVTWQTASEMNSKGYEVQVSTNGTEFRTLTMVPSASPNSVMKQSYSYQDTESNKTGIRYYRLHQLDLDDKDAYFGPIAVNFEGKASAATAMVAYPNPFNSFDELHVALQSSVAGAGKLLVTDMTGRTIAQQNVELNIGLSDLSVTGMTDLKSGLYMVKLTLPSGEVKNLKVVKQ